jgi:hypothetical protein
MPCMVKNCVHFVVFEVALFVAQSAIGLTGKNDLTRRATHREAVSGTVIHSIFDAWYYEVLWTCELTRLL